LSTVAGAVDNGLNQEQLQSNVFKGHTDRVSSLAFSSDGRQALSGAYDDTVCLWDIETRQQICCFKGHTNWVKSVALSLDASKALSGSIDATARLWDCKNGNEIFCFKDHNSGVHSVAFSPDGRYALSGGEDGSIRMWSVETGKEIVCFSVHLTGVTCVAFSPDGRLALAAVGKSIFLYDTNSGVLSMQLDGNKGRIPRAAFSKDGLRLISGSDDGIVRLWDLESGNQLRQFTGYNRWFHDLAFSPEGKYIYASYDSWADNKIHFLIRRWKSESNEAPADFDFTGHKMTISSVAFSPDGRCLLSGSGDTTIWLWDLPK
jgi:WD40 repeat protein